MGRFTLRALGDLAERVSGLDDVHGFILKDDLLLAHAIEWARERGATAVVLLTNTSLEAAGALYRKHGFRNTPFTAVPGYARTNARMMLALDEAPAIETRT